MGVNKDGWLEWVRMDITMGYTIVSPMSVSNVHSDQYLLTRLTPAVRLERTLYGPVGIEILCQQRMFLWSGLEMRLRHIPLSAAFVRERHRHGLRHLDPHDLHPRRTGTLRLWMEHVRRVFGRGKGRELARWEHWGGAERGGGRRGVFEGEEAVSGSYCGVWWYSGR